MLSGWLTACDYDIVVEPLERVGGSPINKVAVNVWEFVSRFSPRWKIAFFFSSSSCPLDMLEILNRRFDGIKEKWGMVAS